MEKPQHPFDALLKETLKGHQLVPGEKARKAFLGEAAAIVPARRSWFRWYYLPALIVVMSGIVAIFMFQNGNHDIPVDTIQHDTASSSYEQKIQGGQDNPVYPSDKTTQSSLSTPIITPEKQASEIAGHHQSDLVPAGVNEKPGVSAAIEKPVMTETVSEETAGEVEINENVSLVHAELQMADKPADDTISEQTEFGKLTEPVGQENPEPLGFSEAISDTIAIGPQSGLPDLNSGETKPGLTYASGVYYLPEIMFNTIEGNKFVNNFGIEFVFYHGRISLTTGAGLSISKGVTGKSVEYNEFLGTYNKLDSITFSFDESVSDFTPTIHTSSENVWDSLSLYDSMEIIKRYTYLQLPLLIGFDFWNRDKLTVGVKIGTIMSIMLNSSQLTGVYDPGSNQVIGIDNLSPDQVSINWQAVSGITGSYQLTKRLMLEIEPQVRYYYQSIYEKSDDVKKPWSVGLRTALHLKF